MANNNTALIPEIWAASSIRYLEANTNFVKLVNGDYSADVARMGSVVHTNLVAPLPENRRYDFTQPVPTSDVSASPVTITMNQLVQQSILLDDMDVSLATENLFAKYGEQMALAMARTVERIIAGQIYQFMSYGVGVLESTASISPVQPSTMKAQTNLIKRGVTNEELIAVLSPGTYAALVQNPAFSGDYVLADQGTVARTGLLGYRYGISFARSAHLPEVTTSIPTNNVVVQAGTAASAGATSLTLNVGTYAGTGLVVGSWFYVNDAGYPHRVLTVTGGIAGQPASITFTPELVQNVASGTSITATKTTTTTAAFAAGYMGPIAIAAPAYPLTVGQMISFGSEYHAVIRVVDSTHILLDRPLEAAVSSGAVMGISPAGNYNFMMTRDAIGIAMRSLHLPPTIGNNNVSGAIMESPDTGIPMRVVTSYDAAYQKTRVTMDLLMGITVLNPVAGNPIFA